jgi:hypothetical protein
MHSDLKINICLELRRAKAALYGKLFHAPLLNFHCKFQRRFYGYSGRDRTDDLFHAMK